MFGTSLAGIFRVSTVLFRAALNRGLANEQYRTLDHARALADALVEHVKALRTAEERTAPLHIFASAPVGFAFFLGQMARGFGRHVLYEFDFEANTPDGYSPSLVFPPLKTASADLKGVPTA